MGASVVLQRLRLIFYRKDQYQHLLNLSNDRNSLPDTWDEWYKEYLKLEKAASRDGQV